MNILVTGATGFVGQALAHAACKSGHTVSALVRAYSDQLSADISQIVLEDFNALTEQMLIASDIDVIVHAAARAHVMHDQHSNPAEIYHAINVSLTEHLAKIAARAGVKRFVFISSIKVNGESTAIGRPFTEQDVPAPEDDYGRSKWQAEQQLKVIGQETGMEIVILRPPLIYGPGVKGNFASLMKWMQKSLPLPLGAIHNKRSLLALENLISAILLSASHPAAANQTYLLADEKAVSTTELLKNIALAQDKKARLLPVPASWLRFLAKILGKAGVADRLLGSLEVKTDKIRQQLAWQPVISMPQQLKKCSKENS